MPQPFLAQSSKLVPPLKQPFFSQSRELYDSCHSLSLFLLSADICITYLLMPHALKQSFLGQSREMYDSYHIIPFLFVRWHLHNIAHALKQPFLGQSRVLYDSCHSISFLVVRWHLRNIVVDAPCTQATFSRWKQQTCVSTQAIFSQSVQRTVRQLSLHDYIASFKCNANPLYNYTWSFLIHCMHIGTQQAFRVVINILPIIASSSSFHVLRLVYNMTQVLRCVALRPEVHIKWFGRQRNAGIEIFLLLCCIAIQIILYALPVVTQCSTNPVSYYKLASCWSHDTLLTVNLFDNLSVATFLSQIFVTRPFCTQSLLVFLLFHFSQNCFHVFQWQTF